MLAEGINSLFGGRCRLTAASETFALAEWRLEGVLTCIPDASILQAQILGGLPERDRLVLTISIESEPISLASDQPDALDRFVSDCRARHRVAEPSNVSLICVTVTKTFKDQTVSLYSLTAFAAAMGLKKLEERFGTFEAVCLSESGVWVQLFDDSHPFQSRTLHFSKSAPANLCEIRRLELRSKRNDLCHSEYASWGFVPEDFHLVRRSSLSEINSLFDDLCIGASLIYLADISAPTRNQVSESLGFKWNGYKAIAGVFGLGDRYPHAIAEGWYKIYEWVYSGGGVSDKLGLARNIMSLHWKDSIVDLVESGVLTSIRSGYEIYLRQNVRQYIDAKNKLNDYLADYTARAAKLAEGMADKFEKSVTAFISFAITSILAKVLVDKSFVGIFNKPVAIIGLLIIGGSFLHLILTLFVFNKDRGRIKREWDALKNRYTDVLDAADLARIFEKHGGFNQIEDHLKFKRNLFASVWTALLIIALGMMLWLGDWHSVITPDPSKSNSVSPVQGTSTNR